MEPRETTDAEGSESRTAPVRVLLVDDQQLVREGLRSLKLESRTQIALYAVETRLLERYASLLTAAAHPPAGPPR